MPQQFELDEEERNAVNELKSKLTSPPVLGLPRSIGKFTLDLDASDSQLGCVLPQEQDDMQLKPVGYWSRLMCSAERNYDMRHEECLDVVWSVLLPRPYLEETHFIVRTDHQTLRWIQDLKECTGRLARWCLRLLKFDFETVHHTGAHHQAPDAMSRLPKETGWKEEDPIDEDILILEIQWDGNKEASPVMLLEQEPVPMPTESEIIEAQAEDP